MAPELDQSLCDKYPRIFRDRHCDDSVSCMPRGFEVGDGWYQLIDALCEQLQWESDQDGTQFVATQVKEKLGSLRFRGRPASERQRAMLTLASVFSTRVCEVCGKPIAPSNQTDNVRCTDHPPP